MDSPQRPFHPKVVPPRRRGDIVRRQRLHTLLGDALEHDVVVLTAPAGYGKSTLAVDWLDDADLPLDLDDPVLIMSATYGLAMCYRERGDYPQARSLLEHGLRLADQGGAELQRARFRSGLGATLIGERRHREAIPILEIAADESVATGAQREEALARLRLAIACYHARARRVTLEQLARVAEIVGALGYDQFLVAEARQNIEVVEYGVQRRAGGDYFDTLLARLEPRGAGDEPAPARGAAPAIRAEAFGLPRVLLDGRTVDDGAWGSERSKEMFFFLVHRDERLRKEDIALALWPDAEPERLNSVFHSTLHRLRRAIHRQVVLQEDGVYQVNPEFDIEYDAREFEHLARDAARAGEGSEEWREALARALGLYQGPFGAGFESDWAEQTRRRFEDTYLVSMLALASAALRREDTAEAIRLAESVLEMDATNEEAGDIPRPRPRARRPPRPRDPGLPAPRTTAGRRAGHRAGEAATGGLPRGHLRWHRIGRLTL